MDDMKKLYKSVILSNEVLELVKNNNEIHDSVKIGILETATVLANTFILKNNGEDLLKFLELDKEIDKELEELENIDITNIDNLTNDIKENLYKEWNKFNKPQTEKKLSDVTEKEVNDILDELDKVLTE